MKSLNRFYSESNRYLLLFVAVLAIGVLARIWEYEILPPSLNADEASIGIDAFNLLHYGIDRNGIPFPVQFISWGSGQNALYGYVLIPFIALYGLSRIIVRIPMLISGILTIPLVYFIAKQTLGEAFGLLSMFFIAICPWHILLSRWGLESNFFPFVFLLGYACLLMASKSYSWFILGCIFFALALYAYGTAYAIIPIFMICACWILYKEKQIPLRITLAGILVFTIFALPISLFIVINSFRLNGLHFGLMTIPRLPTIPRYESQSAFFGNQILLTLSTNISILFKLLITQSDGIAYNVVEPFGYFYTITFPLAVIGAGVLIHYSYKSYQTKLLLAWLAAALISGVLEPVNINRINIIFIPLILCIAACVLWITNTSKVYLGIATGIFFIGFICFMAVYNSPNYREKANRKFYTGILPALDFARQFGSNPICVTDKFNMPYIFALFSEKENPADYLASVKYVDPQAPLRQVLSFGRYTFGIKNCKQNPLTIFIVLADEKQPRLGENYRTRDFSNFTLYYPIP